MSTDGIVRVDQARDEIARRLEQRAHQANQRVAAEVGAARLHDQQHARATGRDRQPAGGGHLFAKRHHGQHGDHQRRRHVDGRRVRQRDVEQGDQIAHRGQRVEARARHDAPVKQVDQVARRAHGMGNDEQERRSHDAAQQDQLRRRQRLAHVLDQGVVGDEGGHAGGDRQHAAAVVGMQRPGGIGGHASGDRFAPRLSMRNRNAGT